MNFQLDIQIPLLEPRIQYESGVMLNGSCFTEHINRFLNKAKFRTVQNSHGILFNPLSVCKALEDVIERKQYTKDDLFLLDEYWHSWYHHSDFSDLDRNVALERINNEIETQHHFLKTARYLIITLGSAFAYKLIEKNIFVNNNHRAPAQWFEKVLLNTDLIIETLQNSQSALRAFNPNLSIIFTVSPVRHVRDGVIENNRSKARLLEAVHSLSDVYYFPAYELVNDILRDYRFYDIDMVHPNYQATQYVWEKFVEHCIDPSCVPLMKHMERIYKAKNHIPKDSNSKAHQKFLHEHLELCLSLQKENPALDLNEELSFFSENNSSNNHPFIRR